MAAPSNPSVIALDKAALSKTVQQMSIDGDQPSQTYTVKDFKFGALETSPPLAPIPIIDISCFLSPTSLEQEETELAKLRSALAAWGCFQAVNHGISSSFIENVREVVQGFFQLPVEEKRKSSRKPGSSEGYGTDAVVRVVLWILRALCKNNDLSTIDMASLAYRCYYVIITK